MFNIGAITGQLILESGKWDAAIKSAKESAKSLEGAIMNNDSKITKLGLTLAATGAAIIALDTKMLRLAMDSQMTGTLFAASFGKMSVAAKSWSEGLSKAFTLNISDVQQILAQLNNMSKGLGIADDSAYKMSKSLTVLSLQMSRFFGISQEDAAGRLQMALAGMTRSLRELGIVIKEQDVNQYALTHGIIRQGEALSSSQRALVVYSLLIEKTKFIQDSMASSSKNLTSLWYIFSGQAKELGETLGATLIPMASMFLQSLTGLVKGMNELASRFPAVTGAFMVGGAALGILAAGAGAALLALPGLATAAAGLGVTMGALAGTVSLTILGIAGAVMVLAYAIENFDLLKSVFYSFAQGVNQAFADIQGGIARFFLKASQISPILKAQFEELALSFQASAAQFAEDASRMGQAAGDSYSKQMAKNEEFKVKLSLDTDIIGNKFDQMWQGAAEAAKNATDVMGKGDWLNGIQRQVASFGAFGQQIHGILADSIGSTFYDLTMGLSTLQEAAANFGRNILKMLFDIAAQWIALKILMGLGFTAVSMGTPAVAATAPSSYVPLRESLPSFDSGISNVPYDMIARIHKGEEVVPANKASQSAIQLTIQNNITNEAIAMAMQSREGSGVIINTINADSLRNGVTRREVIKR